MMRTLQHILAQLAKLATRLRGPNSSPQQESMTPVTEGDPLAGVYQAVRRVAPAVEQQLDAARTVVELVDNIEERLALAWRERERLLNDYNNLLRRAIAALDDCQALSEKNPDIRVVQLRLEEALREQGIKVIDVAEGEPFRSEFHCCEQTVPSVEDAPGMVLRVLDTGYQRRLADGSVVIVRPARVILSQS